MLGAMERPAKHELAGANLRLRAPVAAVVMMQLMDCGAATVPVKRFAASALLKEKQGTVFQQPTPQMRGN